MAVQPFVALGEFSTVINVPPDVAPNRVDSDTQLNVYDGGTLPFRFSSPSGRTNVEINIFGGLVSDGFTIHDGATANVTGGSFAYMFVRGGSMRLAGDFVGDRIEAHPGSTVEYSGGAVASLVALETDTSIFGGTIERLGISHGSTVDITGGSIDDVRVFFDNTVNISGGSIGGYFQATEGGNVAIYGREFHLNGELVEGLVAEGSRVTLGEISGVVTGSYADGLRFSIEGAFSDNVLTLVTVPEPSGFVLVVTGLFVLRRRDAHLRRVSLGGGSRESHSYRVEPPKPPAFSRE